MMEIQKMGNKWKIKIKNCPNFPKKEIPKKERAPKNQKNLIKIIRKFPFMEIDPIKISFLGNKPDQKYCIC